MHYFVNLTLGIMTLTLFLFNFVYLLEYLIWYNITNISISPSLSPKPPPQIKMSPMHDNIEVNFCGIIFLVTMPFEVYNCHFVCVGACVVN